MKKIIAILILTALAISLLACSNSGVEIPDGMQLASNSDVAYNLFIPGGWILTKENGICGAYYSSSDKSNITMSSFYPEADMASIDDYWQKCKASYGETYKNFAALEEETQIVFGEKAAFKYVFTADIDGASYKFMQIITVHSNMFYTLTYTAKTENYDLHLEDVEKTISEFEFK